MNADERVPVDLEQYTQSRMSPFDERALHILLQTFERKNLTILEIGSWLGAGSTQIFAEYAEKLVCVDHWVGNDNETHRKILAQIDVFAKFWENVDAFKEKVIPIRSNSDEIGALLADGLFDFIFIDGDHRYQQTKKDIMNSLPKVKAGGMLAGHDCEGRITSDNEEKIVDFRDLDHVESAFPRFKEMHPGVIVAVGELLDSVFLFADEDNMLKFNDENGNTLAGHSTIWCAKI